MYRDDCGWGQCLPGFPILQRTLQRDVCLLPRVPVIIGNVRGAHQMLPGPDWKAEDKIGVPARASLSDSSDKQE